MSIRKFNNRDNRLETNRIYGHNGSGEFLAAGTPVYVSSNVNGLLVFGKCDAAIASSMPAVGLLETGLQPNQEGNVIIGGFAELSIEGLVNVGVRSKLYVASGGGLSTTATGEEQAVATVLETFGTTVAKKLLVAFGGAAPGGGANEFVDPEDTPVGYGTSGQVLASTGTATEWIDAPSPIGQIMSFVTRNTAFSALGDHEGTVITLVGMTPSGTGLVNYWNGGAWSAANATTAADADAGVIGLQTGALGQHLLQGVMQLTSVPGSAGDVLYLNTTDGQMTATPPSGTGNIVRVVGYNIGSNRVYFDASRDWLEIV